MITSGRSGVSGWRFDVVIDADCGQQPVRAALVDPDPRLRWQVMAAPADAVIFRGATHAVIGHGTVLRADATALAEAPSEEGAELTGGALSVIRAKGAAVISVRLEGTHDRLGVTSDHRGLVAADHITGMGEPGLEDGGPQVALPFRPPSG
jgi:hypothetical protein